MSATCYGSVFQAIHPFALPANHRLAVSCPFQRIVGSAILQDAVEALSVPGYVSVEIGSAQNEPVLGGILQVVAGSQVAVIGIIFLGGREDDGLGLVLSVVKGGVDIPCSVHFLGANHGVAARPIECRLDGAARVVDGSEDELAEIAGTDTVVGIAR